MQSASGPDGSPQNSTFEFGVRLGIVLIAEAACLSALAVTSLLLYILASLIVIVALKRGSSKSWNATSRIHYYFINLLISDLIQAIGGIIDIKWALEAAVTEGAICTVQGIFKQMGDVAVALTSLTIAVHTFSVLVLHLQSGLKTALLVISVIWIFIALVVGIGIAAHKGQIYYGNTQYWCWITTDYNAERIGLEYAWMWTAALVNIFCYMVIALVIKGVMIVDGGRIRFRRRSRPRDSVSSIFRQHPLRGEAKQANAIAMQMLFYPLIYLITVFPITLVRWLAFAGRSVPFSATAFAAILFSSSGLLNVTLFVLTRPGLLPGRGKSLTTTQNSYPLSTTLSPTSKPESPSFDFSNIRGTTSPRMTLAKLPALHVKGNSDVSQLYEGASV